MAVEQLSWFDDRPPEIRREFLTIRKNCMKVIGERATVIVDLREYSKTETIVFVVSMKLW